MTAAAPAFSVNVPGQAGRRSRLSTTCLIFLGARDAICVDADTCDSNGLICKSKFDAAFAEVQDKVRKYNQLVDEFNDLKADLVTLQRTKRNINDCLTFAKTLSNAKSCSR